MVAGSGILKILRSLYEKRLRRANFSYQNPFESSHFNVRNKFGKKSIFMNFFNHKSV